MKGKICKETSIWQNSARKDERKGTEQRSGMGDGYGLWYDPKKRQCSEQWIKKKSE